MTSNGSLASLLTRAETAMWREFEEASAFDNTSDIGEVREQGLARFLSDRLPSKYKVARGEVVDAGGFQSGQTDILIYDGSSTAPLLTKPNVLVLLPVEALLASIEVKSKLTREEFRKSVRGVGKLRDLRPFGSPWGLPKRNGSHADDGLPSFFSTVFAYESTIEKDWDSLEIRRVREVCSETAVPTEWIDRVVVLSQGIVLPAAGRVARFQSDQQVLGLWFFHLMNFLARESARRDPFPWALYERSLSPQWSRQVSPLADAPMPKKASQASRRRYLRKASK